MMEKAVILYTEKVFAPKALPVAYHHQLSNKFTQDLERSIEFM